MADKPTFDARTEKNLATLLPAAQTRFRRFLEAANRAINPQGVTVKLISGTRSYSEQDALYAQGRTAPGNKVTNARSGQSWHNFGLAGDIGIFHGADYLEESPLYKTLGVIGKAAGLEWGGDWQGNLVDMPHYQLATGLSLSEMDRRHRAGIPLLQGTPYEHETTQEAPAAHVEPPAAISQEREEWTVDVIGKPTFTVQSSETHLVRVIGESLGARVVADSGRKRITLSRRDDSSS